MEGEVGGSDACLQGNGSLNVIVMIHALIAVLVLCL